MVKWIVNYFDKLEDRIRIALSHRPIPYAIIGGVGIILFWKGVWETAELFPVLYGPVSMVMGVVTLLLTGLMVSFFVGDSIILSGFKREKKLVEKTENEVRSEKDIDQLILEKLEVIEAELERIKGPGK
ncbi:MAG: hypothetical protein WC217_02360 [Candidatus Paceibacterota bacterium]|jgi:hypothetical protein